MPIKISNGLLEFNHHMECTKKHNISIKCHIALLLELNEDEFYLTRRGKLVENELLEDIKGPVQIFPRIFGGKGGFGSMLRAIGAQIEKTTNRDACRDLSGRRLRDINEEQRLKRWFAKQSERELERVEMKKRKLEKLRQLTEGPPLPVIDDQQYNKQRADMADSVYDAVDKGFDSHDVPSKASSSSVVAVSTSDESSTELSTEESCTKQPSSAEPCSSSSSSTRKPEMTTTTEAKKKPTFKKLMLDEDLDSGSSSEEETSPKRAKLE